MLASILGVYMVKGTRYVEADEKFDRKNEKKTAKKMKTAGVATALRKASKDKTKLPKVKGQKKVRSLKDVT